MSALEKAEAEAVAAAQQSDRYAEILAVVAAVQAVQSQCQHQVPATRQSANVGKWLALGAAGSLFLLAFAVSMVALAIGAVSVAVVALVLRSIWADVQQDKR